MTLNAQAIKEIKNLINNYYEEFGTDFLRSYFKNDERRLYIDDLTEYIRKIIYKKYYPITLKQAKIFKNEFIPFIEKIHRENVKKDFEELKALKEYEETEKAKRLKELKEADSAPQNAPQPIRINVKNITPDYNAAKIMEIFNNKINDYQTGKITTLPRDIGNNKNDYTRFYKWIEIYLNDSGNDVLHWWTEFVNLYDKIKPKPPKVEPKPKIKIELPDLGGKELKKIEKPKFKKLVKEVKEFTQEIPENFKLNYPYKTDNKKAKFKQLNPNTEISNKIQDFNLKKIKKEFSKPNYAAYPYTYEMDFLQLGARGPYYLILLNVNTRFLIVEFSKFKDVTNTIRILTEILKKYRIDMLKFDGERAFNADNVPEIQKFFITNGIKYHRDASPFTYHNKSIDAAIKTIRNLFGPNSDHLLKQPELMREMVFYYNNTYHRSTKMTPSEMMADISEEWTFIRKMDRKAYEIKSKMTIYPNGTIVMVYLDFGKMPNKFKKRRRNFDDVGEVVGFENGNYKLKMLTSLKNEISGAANSVSIKVPQFAAQFLANDFEAMAKNKNIIETFNLNIK